MSGNQAVIEATCLVGTSLSIGLSAGITGPAFVHLEYILHTDTAGLGLSSIGENLGYITGSVLCWLLFNHINKSTQVVLSYTWMGVTLALAPWMPNVYLYYVIMFLHNAGAGYIFVYLQVYLLNILADHRLKDACAQGLHAMWMMGSFICPYIVLPFLSDLPVNDASNTNTTTTTDCANTSLPSYNTANFTPHHNAACLQLSNSPSHHIISNGSSVELSDISTVRYAYITVAGLNLLSALVLAIVFYSYSGRDTIPTKGQTEDTPITTDSKPEEKNNNKQSKYVQSEKEDVISGESESLFCYKLLLYVLVSCHVGLGLVAIYVVNTYLSAFVIKGLQWREVKSGPLVISVYRSFNCVGGLLGVPLSLLLSPARMLVLYTGLAAIGYMLLLFSSYHPVMVWVAVVVSGFGVSTLYASMLLLGAQYIPVTPFYGTALVSVGAVASMAGASVTGVLFQRYTHNWVVYVALGSVVLSAGLFIAILITGRTYLQLQKHGTANKYTGQGIIDKNMDSEDYDTKSDAQLIAFDFPSSVSYKKHFPQPVRK